MAYEPRNGDFTLFQSRGKRTPKSPDYWGTALIDGVPYKIAAWKKQSGGRPPFLSGRIEVDDGSSRRAPGGDDDDSVPF